MRHLLYTTLAMATICLTAAYAGAQTSVTQQNSTFVATGRGPTEQHVVATGRGPTEQRKRQWRGQQRHHQRPVDLGRHRGDRRRAGGRRRSAGIGRAADRPGHRDPQRRRLCAGDNERTGARAAHRNRQEHPADHKDGGIEWPAGHLFRPILFGRRPNQDRGVIAEHHRHLSLRQQPDRRRRLCRGPAVGLC